MYNFLYNKVTPASIDNSKADLDVTGYTMVGITPTLCTFNPDITIDFPVYEGEER
jgi:hypothetical protein